jgi:arylsulfatase A-like enzyme
MTKIWVRVLVAALVLSAAIFYFKISRKPPNILLITIDTVRADHLGAYGYSKSTSPNLDRFASENIVFENAFCLMPTTVPSHASIFLGTWPRVHGSTSNFQKVNSSLAYFPKLLKKSGYHAAAFVSAEHLKPILEPLGGFDVFSSPKMVATADETLPKAIEWLRQNRKYPYFLWIHLWDPHSPYLLHPEFMKRINPNFQDNDFEKRYAFVGKDFYNSGQISQMIDLYDNEIAFTDDQLGKFLSAFRGEDFDSNTAMIITSDHGETLGELMERDGYAFDHGEFLYDQQLHVPLIVALPGEKIHKKITASVSLMDLMPTVLKLAEILVPSTCSGASLLPLIHGQNVAESNGLIFLQRRNFNHPRREYLAFPEFGIRERKFKLIYNAGQGEFLYQNNQEVADVSKLEPALKSELSKRLKEWLKTTEEFSKHPASEVPKEEAERLRSLGYVQ